MFNAFILGDLPVALGVYFILQMDGCLTFMHLQLHQPPRNLSINHLSEVIGVVSSVLNYSLLLILSCLTFLIIVVTVRYQRQVHSPNHRTLHSRILPNPQRHKVTNLGSVYTKFDR